jgi:hypothetical protein
MRGSADLPVGRTSSSSSLPLRKLPLADALSVFSHGKRRKTPPPARQWGSKKSCEELEPNHRAGWQQQQLQRIRKQQVLMTIHKTNLAIAREAVKWILAPGFWRTGIWLRFGLI